MANQKGQDIIAPPCGVSTAEYAKRRLVQPQTVRKRYSTTGEYYGDRPIKLPNGRLLWPADGSNILLERGCE